MNQEIVIERRFRGPPNSGNGGYACGVVAAGIEGVATASLRRPPPLDTAMSLIGDGEQSRLMDGDVLVGEATADTLELEVPEAPDPGLAIESSRRYAGFESHPFPGCFVCGPDRTPGDGLRIFPGAVDGSTMVAAPWTPDPTLSGADGLVDRRNVWAALDCPSYFGLGTEPRALLGRLTASIDRLPEVGEPLVAIGWPRGVEGRKHFGGSALADSAGTVFARAAAIWIEIDELPL
ncbi:MAG: hypothetical protein ACRDWS_07690 [Acidimicrobiia bacterium]